MQDYHKYWIGFNQIRGIGPSRIKRLQSYFTSLEAAWFASTAELMSAGLGNKLAAAVCNARTDTDLDALSKSISLRGIQVLCWEDLEYPRRLLETDSPPPVIFLRGELAESDLWAVAVVGTRRFTAYGKQVAEELSAFLAGNGITVVSGLARGVDTVAHKSALFTGGRTLAVLGSGVDRIYPPENTRLVQRMIESGQGAVLSDYPVGTRPDGHNFPPRNRIIAGLSLAVIVVEAGEKSGALITAKFAVEQNREVFAVPGNITSPGSVGTNKLIQRGAHPYTHPDEVLDVLAWVKNVQYPNEHKHAPAQGLEKDLFEMLKKEPRHIDDLSILMRTPIDQLTALLTVMELKGLVRQVSSMKYSAN